jgi:hypothetical protein
MRKILTAAALMLGALSCKAPPFPAVEGESPPAPPPSTEAAAPSGGTLTLPETTVDLGDVNRGDWAMHTFVLSNKSSKVVHVKNVRGS